MDSLKRLLTSFISWYVVGYLVVVAGGASLFARAADDREALRQEIARRQAFEDRRAFEMCESGNEYRKNLVDAMRQADNDLIAASQASRTPEERRENEDDIRSYRARRERSYTKLGPRDCREATKLSEEQVARDR